MTLPAWFARMNRRERLLSTSVAAVVFALINLFLWNWVLGAVGHAREELVQRKSIRKEQEIFVKERDLWTQREQWLQQHQPAFNGASEASTLLEQQLKPVAAKYNVLLDNPQIGSGETTPSHQTVWASVDTKSDWPSLVHFLYDVQGPEAFVVFENVTMSVDSSDPTKMHGKFKVARWFAPALPRKS
ncbi:MAG: hypothetical protein ACJ8M1_10905 [Chthoniobacterales bacterium]|jgi:hypothetical protein